MSELTADSAASCTTVVSDPSRLRGLHLFHSDFSNCSQRVRWALAEKQLHWCSHPIDLLRGDHLESWYQDLNEHGVVPTLVDDGQVIMDSTAIIEHLQRRAPTPHLGARNARELQRMHAWFDMANEFQPCLKILTFECILPARRPEARVALAAYRQRQRNPQLVAFMEEFCSSGGIDRAKVTACRGQEREFLRRLNVELEGAPYLLGERFSLADIALGVNVERLLLSGTRIDCLQSLTSWYGRIAQRPAFSCAASRFGPSEARDQNWK